MIKLKELINESNVWDRKFGEPLPTLFDVMEKKEACCDNCTRGEVCCSVNEQEKKHAMNTIKGKIEITRFKGLGEISPDEFKDFIGENIRLEPVVYRGDESIENILTYYMGKNTQERQAFIIENLNYEAI